MTQCQPLLMMILACVVGLAVGSRRVVRSHISQGQQPYYGIEHRRYLARRAMLRRQGLEEKDEGEEIETGEADQKYEQAVVSNPLQFGFEIGDGKESRSYSPHSGCEIRHETVTVVKQVPSFTKHCQKVEDTKCKTIYKNAFTTQIETQCMATFDTSCDDTLETAYKQQCKTIVDVECRIVNLESKDGHHESKKICEDVPTEKCIPVPVKVEGQKCVNVPTQMCENVPVTVAQEVPQQQCYKKPRKVCQTLVTTKPKVVTEQVPQEVCGHSALKTQQGRKPKTQKKTAVKQKPSPKKELSMFPGGLGPRLKQSEREKVPVFEEPTMGYKKEDIPLFEDASKSVNQYAEDDIDEDPFRGYGNNYLDHIEEEDEEMQGYGSNMVQEEVEYDEYREREEARAAALHNYYKQLRGHQSDSFYYPDQHGDEYYKQVDRGFGPEFQKSVDSLMNR